MAVLQQVAGQPPPCIPPLRGERKGGKQRVACAVRPGDGGRLGAGRDDARVGDGQAGQHGVRHHQRRGFRQVGVLPGAGLRPQHSHRDVQLRGGASQRGGAGQAAADYAGQLHHQQGRPAGDDGGVSGRRQPDAGQRAVDAERHPVRDGSAAGGGSAALRHSEQRQLLLSSRLPPGAAGPGAGHTGDHRRGAAGDGAQDCPRRGLRAWGLRCRYAIRRRAISAPGQTRAGPATLSRCRQGLST